MRTRASRALGVKVMRYALPAKGYVYDVEALRAALVQMSDSQLSFYANAFKAAAALGKTTASETAARAHALVLEECSRRCEGLGE